MSQIAEGCADLGSGVGVTGIVEDLENRGAERGSVTALDAPLRSCWAARFDGHSGACFVDAGGVGGLVSEQRKTTMGTTTATAPSVVPAPP